MKKLMLVLIIGLVAFSVYGQNVIKLRTTDFCYQTKSEYSGEWLGWSNWQSVNILVVIDLSKLQIIIYSEALQVYDIVESFDIRYNSDYDEIYEFRAIDQDGIYCGIRFIIGDDSGRKQLYIDYSDMSWVYNVYSVN